MSDPFLKTAVGDLLRAIQAQAQTGSEVIHPEEAEFRWAMRRVNHALQQRATKPKKARQGKRIYYVDIPRPHSTGEDDAWTNVATTGSKAKAQEYLLKRWGIKARDSALFITEGDVI
jgi:hypothetical protein